MQHRLLSAILLVAVPIGVAASCALVSPDWWVALIVSGATVLVLDWLGRESRGFNPIHLILTLLAGACVSVGALWVLTLLPPSVVIVAATLIVLLAVAAHFLAGGRLRERRALAGMCPKCEYDLRESTDRCPECGTPLPEELARRRRIAAELSSERNSSSRSGVRHDDEANPAH